MVCGRRRFFNTAGPSTAIDAACRYTFSVLAWDGFARENETRAGVPRALQITYDTVHIREGSVALYYRDI